MDNGMVVASLNDYPEAKFNRLFPCTLTQLSPLHKVMVNVVSINPDPERGDVYDQKDKKGVSLTKIACLKLMTAANTIMEDSRPIMPAACRRCIEVAKMTKLAPQCGPCKTKEDVAYQVSILVPEPSGGYRRYVATKEINKANYKGLLEHMAAQCETKALLRALRAGLGIKGAYTKEELSRPFAVAVVVLNATDPELKAALIQRFATGESALFGAPQMPQLSGGGIQSLPDGRSVDVTTGEVMGDDEDGQIAFRAEIINSGQSDEEPPWGPATTDKFDNAITCEGCAKVIESANGWTVEAIKEYSQKHFQLTLCPACQKARSGQRRGA